MKPQNIEKLIDEIRACVQRHSLGKPGEYARWLWGENKNLGLNEYGIALYRAYTGKGIGKKLFSYTLDAAKACGYETAELTVFAKNVHARGMYESFGFTETGRIKNANKYDDGTYDDAILMMKDLKQ